MMMMDQNNTEIAALIQTWLEGKGLTNSRSNVFASGSGATTCTETESRAADRLMTVCNSAAIAKAFARYWRWILRRCSPMGT